MNITLKSLATGFRNIDSLPKERRRRIRMACTSTPLEVFLAGRGGSSTARVRLTDLGLSGLGLCSPVSLQAGARVKA